MLNKKHSLSLLRDLSKNEIKKKRVLVRVDFNVPLNEDLLVTDDTRIKAALQTIQYLVSNDCIVILMSHLGRPKGKVIEKLRLDPIANRLEQIINKKVIKLNDCIGEKIQQTISNLLPGDIVLLENLRFHMGEEDNDPLFAKQLSSLADIFVNDAFGAAHRSHASTVGIASYLPAYAGFLMENELESLDKLLSNPDRPFISIIGGAKVSSKIEILDKLTEISDKVLIGGGMAYTFLAAQGFEIGKSIFEENQIGFVTKLMNKAKSIGKEIIIPKDIHVAVNYDDNSQSLIVPVDKIEKNMAGMDIGNETIIQFKEAIKSSKKIFWNGPLGVIEIDKFAYGTNEIASQIASLYGTIFSVVGGGDSIAAINKLGLYQKFSHISTGGGASLEYVAGRKLPGIEILRK